MSLLLALGHFAYNLELFDLTRPAHKACLSCFNLCEFVLVCCFSLERYEARGQI